MRRVLIKDERTHLYPERSFSLPLALKHKGLRSQPAASAATESGNVALSITVRRLHHRPVSQINQSIKEGKGVADEGIRG